MIDYDYRTVSVATGQPTGTIIKIFGENSRRVALQVYAAQSVLAQTVYGLNNRNLSTLYWAIAGIPSFEVYPYRDFGPIIQGEVWLLCYDTNATWTVNEVYRIG